MDDPSSQKDLGSVVGSGPPYVCETAEAGDFNVIAQLWSEGVTTTQRSFRTAPTFYRIY
jgi:hypothetical protein